MSYDNPRIKIDMSILDIIVALSEGNPGACTVLPISLRKTHKSTLTMPLAPLVRCFIWTIWIVIARAFGDYLRTFVARNSFTH
jgi:hypothetical protein